MHKVRGPQMSDHRESSERHEQVSIAINRDDPASRLCQRDTKRNGRGKPHRTDHVEVRISVFAMKGPSTEISICYHNGFVARVFHENTEYIALDHANTCSLISRAQGVRSAIRCSEATTTSS